MYSMHSSKTCLSVSLSHLLDKPDNGDLFDWLHVLCQRPIPLQTLKNRYDPLAEKERVELHLQLLVQLL